MKDTKFTVLLSVYQKEKPEYLFKSLESIVNQSLIPDEIILVEDGPLTLDLETIIDNFIAENPNILKRVVIKKNVGLGLALNRGIKESSNELIARMDTDDIAKHNRFEAQVNVFKADQSLSIVGSNIDEFSENINNVISQRRVPEKNKDIIRFSKRRNPFNHPTVMYKKEDVLECGGYKDYRRSQDYDLFVRMLNKGYIGYNIQESLLFFRADGDNMKRRKSWVKTRNDIKLRYKFYKEGYSSFGDFLIMTIGFIVVFITPNFIFKYINDFYLRK